MSDKTKTLDAILEQLTRIGDMMEGDRGPVAVTIPARTIAAMATDVVERAEQRLTKPDPLTDEPPVGSMVTWVMGDGDGIFRHHAAGWSEWNPELCEWTDGTPLDWEDVTWSGGTYHLTTDAERKAAGIPDEDPDGRARNDDEQCGARHPANSSIVACMLKQGHNGDHQSSTGCAGSAAAWAQDDLAAAAHRAAKDAGIGDDGSRLIVAKVPRDWTPETTVTDAVAGTAFSAIAAGIEAQEGIE